MSASFDNINQQILAIPLEDVLQAIGINYIKK